VHRGYDPEQHLEHRRYDQSEYEPFWAAAAALDLPLSLHTATRRQGRIRGAGDKTLRDASSRATKAFYPALSLCDLIFSGVFERHPRLRVAIVELELAPNASDGGAPPALHGETASASRRHPRERIRGCPKTKS
jgi:predicted TIM-barrel fold metal-dependent hydrolase